MLSGILKRRQNCFASLLKRGLLKKREFASSWEQILFLLDPFSEGDWCKGTLTGSHKSYLPRKKWWKINQMYQVSSSPFKNIKTQHFHRVKRQTVFDEYVNSKDPDQSAKLHSLVLVSVVLLYILQYPMSP